MKILIVGSVASGKTTFAKKISKKLNIKFYEIDSVVHDDLKKRKRSVEEQKKIFDNINKYDDWIIEGTLRKNLDYLLDYANKVIYLNVSKRIRNTRIIIRFLKQKLRLEKTNYIPTFEMLKMMYIWDNNFEKNKLSFENKLYKYREKVIELKNIKEINNFEIKKDKIYEKNCS